mmetsp:Transcript_23147/g.43806  ORF Transcript_23147/g.43806 Transcript_23147/m.43806 type:complete len:341 (-) Transcript_23147:382-1404(-)
MSRYIPYESAEYKHITKLPTKIDTYLLIIRTSLRPLHELQLLPNLQRTPPTIPHVVHNRLTRRRLTQTRLTRGEVPSASRLPNAVPARQSRKARAPSLVAADAIGVHEVARLHLLQREVEVIRYQGLVLGDDEGVDFDFFRGHQRAAVAASVSAFQRGTVQTHATPYSPLAVLVAVVSRVTHRARALHASQGRQWLLGISPVMYPERGVDQSNPLGALHPILLSPSTVGGVTVLQIRHAFLELVGDVWAQVEVETVHLLDGVVNTRDEGGIGNGVLRGSVAILIVVGTGTGRGGEYVLAVLAPDAHLTEGDGPIASVDGEDRVCLCRPKSLNKLAPQYAL